MSAKIITVFNQKGGCAKTMTTMQLAGIYALRGLKVFVVDMDSQNTATLWSLGAEADTPFPATVLSFAPLQEGFLQKLPPLMEKYDLILIDCPPALGSRVPWAALSIADLAIVPVIPVMDNVWASRQAEDLILQARDSRIQNGVTEQLKAAYLLSIVRRGKVYAACLDELKKGSRIPILSSHISHRNAFPESQLFGSCVNSDAMGSSAASAEVDKVADEVAALAGLKNAKRKGVNK